jgi:hypothetical protein
MTMKKTPTSEPPTAGTAASDRPGTTAPKPLTDELLTALVGDGMVESRPTLLPPSVAGSAEAELPSDGATGTWQNNRTVTALWSINETRNAFMHVHELGWRKLYNGRDSAFVALTALASQARQTGSPIAYREEADGMVYEIYLW